jgi:hypothetical protein
MVPPSRVGCRFARPPVGGNPSAHLGMGARPAKRSPGYGRWNPRGTATVSPTSGTVLSRPAARSRPVAPDKHAKWTVAACPVGHCLSMSGSGTGHRPYGNRKHHQHAETGADQDRGATFTLNQALYGRAARCAREQDTGRTDSGRFPGTVRPETRFRMDQGRAILRGSDEDIGHAVRRHGRHR